MRAYKFTAPALMMWLKKFLVNSISTKSESTKSSILADLLTG